jgi:ubiquinone/menaquinone biosynthesis C-methylase UbiE
MTLLSWTGERYLPWEKDPVTAYEHWHRYAYAAQFVSGKKVLDLAAGEGYGSAALAATARQVIALELDENAVKHARLKYRSFNLHFIVGSILEMPLCRMGFDAIVCFEAIEHIPDPEALLKEVKRLLAPGGIFLVSTPNKPEYKQTEPSNPFHVKELDFEEFRAMLSRHFKRTQFLGQRVYCNSSLWSVSGKPPGDIPEYLLDWDKEEFTLTDIDRRIPLYFVGIASDAEDLPKTTGSVLIDSSNSLLKEASRIQNEFAANAQSLEEALSWRETQLQTTQETLLEQENALAWKEDQLQQTKTAFAWKEDQLRQAQASIRSQEQALVWKEDQLQQAQNAIAWKEDQLRQAQASIRSQEQALVWKEDQLQQAQSTIRSHERALAWRESQVNELTNTTQILRSEYERSAAELSAIKSGRTWRLIQKILKVRNRLLPSGSRRRALYDRWTRF